MAKIQVTKLGKIERAEMRLAPLTILVGKNNTGKTYAASLIWALGNVSLASGGSRRGRRPAWLSKLVQPMNGPERRVVTISADEARKVFAAGLRDLRSKMPDFLSKVFGFDGFSGTSIALTPDDYNDIEVTITPRPDEFAERGTDSGILVSLKIGDREIQSGSYPMFFLKDFTNYVSDRLYYDVFGSIAFGDIWLHMRRPIYIPAARTGLMLALNSLVDDAMDSSGTNESDELPLPLAQFARRMQRGPSRSRQNHSAARTLLLEQMVDGQILYRRGPGKGYLYHPRSVDVALPLHAVSSMITELAPLMVDMRAALPGRHIIFEEPEAHLHLEAQRDMARLIVRLVNEGWMITLTTHSDTFVQQINNLSGIFSHPDRERLLEKFGYEQEDVISSDVIAAYEFQPAEGGHTVVSEINDDGNGLIVPTLNKTLLSLAKETLEVRSNRGS